MQDFEEIIKKLKNKLNIEKDKDLYTLMEVKQGTFTAWRARNKIPYNEIIALCSIKNIDLNEILQNKEKTKIITKNNGNNNISLNGINHGQIHINSKNDLEHKICESVKKLSDKRKMYYYHKIEAELLEDE